MHYVIGRFKHYGKDSNQSVIKYSDMDVDRHKSREELTDELRTLRQETARVKSHRVEMARQQRLLRRQSDLHCRKVAAECAEKNKTVEALQLAELIIDNSPAILFRRLAADDPKLRKMVYVSPNISASATKRKIF
jgi:hypothetical protein